VSNLSPRALALSQAHGPGPVDWERVAKLAEEARPDLDLICYVQPGWEPIIRPAEPTRAWMDASPHEFAYRCLPLDIANAHGWEILTPVGFSACWHGGDSVSGVTVQCDPGMPSISAPVSLFGQATFTIHIQGIFRTPPGWNLMIGGSPNWAKDGIEPLSGVIETDWSPYTFTMNWRFTRQNHWVRFEAGEPICFFHPIQRGVLNRFQPRLAPMSDEPGLSQKFADWSRSRDNFHQKLKTHPPSKPADQWQKSYFRGLYPDDKPAVEDHQTKLRLRPFKP
jgi:hypothetical protein